jgi:exopolysaccharide production protein ExoQ
MTSAWDAPPGTASPRIRRIRGGGEAEPPPRSRIRPRPVQVVTARPAEESFAFAGVDIDGLFAVALFVPMLFIGRLGTAGAAIIAALVPLYLFLRRDRLFELMLPRSFLFLVPAYALFSDVWSSATAETLKYAIELWITVCAGLLLSSARNQVAVMRGICLAFFSYVVASVFFGRYVAVGVGAGGEAFSGLSTSKNLLADIAATGLVVSAVVTLIAVQTRNWFWILFGFASIALDLYCAIAARSAGALLGLAMAVLAIAGLTPLVYAGKVLRAWITSMVGVCLLGIGLSYSAIAQTMINFGTSLFDKDPTLTGRTYLWYRAADLIREHPFLGRGFYAFWLQGDIDAEGLWRYFGIDGRGGFTFHNTFVEILVMLGWPGLILMGAVVLTGVIFLIRRFVASPSLPLVFWIGILLYELARTPIETIGVAPFYFSTALVFGALGAAFRPDRSRRRETEEARANAIALEAWTIASEPPAWAARGTRRPAPGSARLRLVKSGPAEGQ